MLAAGHQRRVAAVQFVLVPIALFANHIFISRFDGDGAAIALLVTVIFGVVVASWWAGRTYGSLVHLATVARTSLATFVVCVISWFWDASGFAVLLKLSCLVIIYGGALLLLRELGPSDLRAMAVWKKP